MKSDDVVYRDIKANENGTAIELPEDDVPKVQLRGGIVRLGYRQLDAERWVASPLYTLELTQDGKDRYRDAVVSDGNGNQPVVEVELKVIDKKDKVGLISDELEVSRVSANTTKSFSSKHVKLQLNTMIDAGLGDSNYWLDSGSVKRK